MRDIIERLNAAWNARDSAAVAELFADDAVHDDTASATVSHGVGAIVRLFEDAWRGMPDVRTEVRDVVAGTDAAAWEWSMTATHTGDFPDLEATGRRFRLRGVSIEN